MAAKVSIKSRLSSLLSALPRALDVGPTDQSGAICCKMGDSKQLQVLLITSRDTGRWVIPRGNIDNREHAFRCAQRESFEEAGVSGKIRKEPFGYYRYEKDGEKILTVAVHLLQVKRDISRYPECGERRKAWVCPSEAASMVLEPDLGELFRMIAGAQPLHSRDNVASRTPHNDLTAGLPMACA